MNRIQFEERNDTPLLSILIGTSIIVGGLPVLILLATKWAESPQRHVAAGVGLVTIALFAIVKKKFETLLVALLFFSQFQISLLSIPLAEPVFLQISFTDVLLALFIAAALERKESLRPDAVGWLLLGLMAWQAIAAFSYSAHLHRSLIDVLWQAKYLVVYLFVRNMPLSDKLAQQVKMAILLILLVQGGLAVAQLIMGRPLGLVVFGEQNPSRLFYVKGGLRVSGTLGATNALAGYMAMLLVFTLPFLFRWQGLFRYGCWGAGFAALLFPLSRAGWLSFVVGGGIAVLGILRAGIVKPTRVMVLGFLGTVIIGAGAMLYLDKIQQRFEDKAAVNSAMGRFYQFEEAWPVIERYPIFGIGTGITEYYGAWSEHEKYVRSRLPGVKLSNQPHNSQLQYWIEAGTPGFILFVAITLATFATALRRRATRDGAFYQTLMQIGAGAAAAAAMVHVSFGPEINHHQIVMTFWIFLALARNSTMPSIPMSDPVTSGGK